MRYFNKWAPYVSVAERKRTATEHAKKMSNDGKKLNPIQIAGRTIASTFWGRAWCENLETYSDYSNRLPRGRSYVRNGSVIDLQITTGKVEAKVSGSSIYNITINIKEMQKEKWQTLVKSCAGKIDSLIELLKGKFSKSVMEVMTEKSSGLFPKPTEISMKCSCPDSAHLCKHIAAVFYGIGACLDSKPEWLFTLRNVDKADLIASVGTSSVVNQPESSLTVAESDLSDLFGIEIDGAATPAKKASKATPKEASTKPKTTPKKAAAQKKTAQKKAPIKKPAKPSVKKVTVKQQKSKAQRKPPK